MDRIVSIEEAFALGGEPVRVPNKNGVDNNLIRLVATELIELGFFASTGSKVNVKIMVTERLGLRSNMFLTGEFDYLCTVPVGLIIRLDYVMRLLEPHANKKSIHINDPSFYGDLPKEMREARDARPLPKPIDFLVDESVINEDFWEQIERLDVEDENSGRSNYRYLQVDQVSLAVKFCALHECCHALRQHHKLLEEGGDRASIYRGAELDADYCAGKWLVGHRVGELKNHIMDNQDDFAVAIVDSSWRMTYSFGVVLGLFDLDRLSIDSFDGDVYQHPTTRFQMAVSGMFKGFEFVYDPKTVISSLISPSGRAAREYMTRANYLWLELDPKRVCRRTSSLYFPFLSEKEPFSAPADLPTMERMYRAANAEYEEFLEKNNSILNSMVVE